MSLKDVGAQQPEKLPRCPIGLALITLGQDDQDTLAAWLADSTKPSNWIENVLREYNFWVGKQSVARHRKGACGCGPC